MSSESVNKNVPEAKFSRAPGAGMFPRAHKYYAETEMPKTIHTEKGNKRMVVLVCFIQ